MGGAMSSIVVSGDTSGTITIAAPAVAGTNTISLPASTGTVALTSQLPVTGPAFSAFSNANQTITSNVFTKVLLQTEEFDTNNNFASSTFTPTVAGYYQVSGCVNNYSSTSPTRVLGVIYKNGTAFKRFVDGAVNTGTFYAASQGSALVYLNGSTDYIELYSLIVASTAIINTDASYVYFQAVYVRAA
jgi:hypothetical protein